MKKDVRDSKGAINTKLDEAFELLDTSALMRASRVLARSAKKRGAQNWRNTDNIEDYVGRAIRHLYLYLEQRRTGVVLEEGDHLANALCRVTFAIGLEEDAKRNAVQIPALNPKKKGRWVSDGSPNYTQRRAG